MLSKKSSFTETRKELIESSMRRREGEILGSVNTFTKGTKSLERLPAERISLQAPLKVLNSLRVSLGLRVDLSEHVKDAWTHFHAIFSHHLLVKLRLLRRRRRCCCSCLRRRRLRLWGLRRRWFALTRCCGCLRRLWRLCVCCWRCWASVVWV